MSEIGPKVFRSDFIVIRAVLIVGDNVGKRFREDYLPSSVCRLEMTVVNEFGI